MILLKKAIRSIWNNKRSYFACILLISIGILSYVSMGVSISDLGTSKDTYYKQYRLADVFAKVNSISKSDENKLLKIDGIQDVSLRLVYDTRVILPDTDKLITLRMISHDNSIENPINNIIKSGNDFHFENDILISQPFLDAHSLSIGDSINIIINGKEVKFNICGTAESPEYVYTIKDSKEILPDAGAFSISYVSTENMAGLYNKHGIFNDISFILEDGYVYDDVKTILEDELSKFGLEQIIPQDKQVSVSMLDTELESGAIMTTYIPAVFVFMAVIILYIMLKRVIEQDRMQIGTLKAFGYTNVKIITHYLFYGAFTGFLGGLIGSISGYFLSGPIGEMYKLYFNLPIVSKSPSVKYILVGFLISIGGGLLGSYMGTKNVIKLLPSEAMRPIAPKVTTKDYIKYFPFLKYVLNSSGNMALRNISRNKFRSLFIVLSITFSFGILAFIGSYPDMIDTIILNQYNKIQLYDSKVNFNNPVSYTSGIESIVDIAHVKQVEGLLEIPVEIKNKNRKIGIVINGIQKNSNLYKIYDDDKRYNISLPENGIILSSTLSKDLEAKKGDILYLHSNILKEDIKVIVSDIVTQNLGKACYVELDTLCKIFNLNKSITSVILNTDNIDYLKDFLKESKNIGYIEDKESSIMKYKDFLASFNYMLYIMAIMGSLIAFSIVYNTATVSLSERKREFATLKVLGMQTKQVGFIMSFEYWLLSFLGILLGFPFTMFLKMSIASNIDIEMFTFPTYTPLSAYIIGVIGCVAAVFISNKVSLNKIKSFDMVEVLKEKE